MEIEAGGSADALNRSSQAAEPLSPIVKEGCGDPRIGTRWALLASGLALLLAVGAAFAQRPPAERPARESAERDERRQPREREDLALAGRRNVLARLLDQLTGQARETEAALREHDDERSEEAIVLRSELQALRDHIGVVERQLRNLERPEVSGRRTEQPRERRIPTVSRERATQDAEIEKVLAELQSQREKSARYARELELKLGELRREGRDEETSAIEIELQEVRENVGRLEREMANVERRRRQRVASPVSREGATQVAEIEEVVAELQSQREKSARYVRELELKLGELRREGRDEETSDIEIELRAVRENVGRLDREMANVERRRRQRATSLEWEAMERVQPELIRKRLQLMAEMEQLEKSLRLCEERGEGQTDTGHELRRRIDRIHDELRMIEERVQDSQEERVSPPRVMRRSRDDSSVIVTKIFQL